MSNNKTEWRPGDLCFVSTLPNPTRPRRILELVVIQDGALGTLGAKIKLQDDAEAVATVPVTDLFPNPLEAIMARTAMPRRGALKDKLKTLNLTRKK